MTCDLKLPQYLWHEPTCSKSTHSNFHICHLTFTPQSPSKPKWCSFAAFASFNRYGDPTKAGHVASANTATTSPKHWIWPWDLNLQSSEDWKDSKFWSIQKSWATPVGFNQKNAWVVDVCRILNGILEAMPIVPQGSQPSQNGCQATQTTLPRRGRAKTTRKIAAKTTDASSKVWVDLFIRRLVQTTGKFFRKGMKMHVYVYKNTYVFYKYNIHPLETANKTETSSPFSEISAPLYLEPRSKKISSAAFNQVRIWSVFCLKKKAFLSISIYTTHVHLLIKVPFFFYRWFLSLGKKFGPVATGPFESFDCSKWSSYMGGWFLRASLYTICKNSTRAKELTFLFGSFQKLWNFWTNLSYFLWPLPCFFGIDGSWDPTHSRPLTGINLEGHQYMVG